MKLLTKSILPIAAILLIALLGQYIYIVNGQIDLFRLCLVFGVPFGIPYMLFVLPIGGSISRGIGILDSGNHPSGKKSEDLKSNPITGILIG